MDCFLFCSESFEFRKCTWTLSLILSRSASPALMQLGIVKAKPSRRNYGTCGRCWRAVSRSPLEFAVQTELNVKSIPPRDYQFPFVCVTPLTTLVKLHELMIEQEFRIMLHVTPLSRLNHSLTKILFMVSINLSDTPLMNRCGFSLANL